MMASCSLEMWGSDYKGIQGHISEQNAQLQCCKKAKLSTAQINKHFQKQQQCIPARQQTIILV